MNNLQRKDTQRDIIVDWLINEPFSNEDEVLEACNKRFGNLITAEYWDVILDVISERFSL